MEGSLARESLSIRLPADGAKKPQNQYRGGHDHTNKPTPLKRQITSTMRGGSYAQPLRLAKMLRSLPEVPDNKLSQPYLNKGPTS
jgi:hypothetical protein